MMKFSYNIALLVSLFLLSMKSSFCEEIQVPDSQTWDSPFAYRSISFGTPSRDGPPDPMGTKVTGQPFEGIRLDLNRDMVRLAGDLGFNDVTIQTEVHTVPKLEALRKWADETGNFRFIKEQDMTISVWVHELCDLPTDIGPPTLDNAKLWTLLRQRYAHLCQLLPEVDYFVLTVVESDLWVTENVDVLTKLVTIVNDECRKANKKLVFRTFLWYVKEADVIMQSLTRIPGDVIVMSKCVPQDWHIRGVDSPFIGRSGKRGQFIEFDIAGEYNKLDHVACAFTDVLRRQLDYAQKHNCDGFAVRVDRYGATPWGQAQEANLWFLGLYGSGRSDDEQKIWRLYATELFGPKAAPVMVEALYPTGDVVAEAICVEQESFGYSRDVTPASRRMNCPFDVLHSPAKWDKSLQPTFEKIASGDPEIIRRKQAAFEKHLASADHSLRLIESVKDELPPGAYPFFRWKLEENRFLLNMFCHMELAWLKDQRMRRTGDAREKDELAAEVRGHLNAFRQMHDTQTGKTLKVTWRGATHSLRRGSCHNWLGWLGRFEEYHRSASTRKVMDTGIAAGKPTTCSSEQAGSHSAGHANDGNPGTRWCADDDREGNWWQVDLTKAYEIERIKVLWQFNDRVYQFKIDGSADGKQWTLLVDETENGEVARQTEHATSAGAVRYVRITVTGLKGRQWASIHEFQVFGRASGEATDAMALSDSLSSSQGNRTDPYRPAYHITPPTGRLGDPNGLCWLNGRYHLFYLHFAKWPGEPEPGQWAHAVSRDMVRWKHLPPAFGPDSPYDSRACWSGCFRIVDGLPTVFYSALGKSGVSAALAQSRDMIHWTKSEHNPLMTPEQLRAGWDHCVWRDGGSHIMLTGGRKGAQLFESKDLFEWRYLHPLLADDPARGLSKWDCPHMFKLGGKQVLIVYAHPGRHSQYYVGRYEDRRFFTEAEGALDLGVDAGGTFSAAHPSYRDPKGRLVLVGMMQERLPGRGPREMAARRDWSNAVSLPRVVTLAEDGLLRFAPIEELRSLRGDHSQLTNLNITPERFELLPRIEGKCLEIIAEIEPRDATQCGLTVLCSPDGQEKTTIVYDAAREVIALKGIEQAFSLAEGEPLRLHVFVDRSLVEVFVNNRVCLSAWTYPTRPDSLGVGLLAAGATAKARRVEVWKLRTGDDS